MTDLSADAELTDRMIDAERETVRDPDSLFTQDLVALAASVRLGPHRAARIWSQVSAATDTPNEGDRRVLSRWHLPRRSARGVGFALVVAAIALLVAVGVLRTAPVEAHDIALKVARGSIDPSSVGLTRYAGSLRVTGWIGPGGRLAVPIVSDERVWFQSPNQVRIETAPPAAGGPTSIVLTDGTQTWLWSPATHTAFRLSTGPTGTLAFLTGTDASALLANVDHNYQAVFDRTETVAGRRADRIILTPLPAAGLTSDVGRIVLSVDEERAVGLAGRVLDRNEQPIFEWDFTQIDFAPTFDKSVAFAPDPGTAISELSTTGVVGTDARWMELARGTSFTLFRPTFRSTGLEPGFPSMDGDRVVVAYHSVTDLSAILIIETVSTRGSEPGETVTLPSGTAIYRRDPDRQRLVVQREGTRIEIQAPLSGSRDDLIAVAGSLVPAR